MAIKVRNGMLCRSTIFWLLLLGFIGVAFLAACDSAEPAPLSSGGLAPAVAPEFTRFYNELGGAHIFGQPLTDSYEANGRMVQYFQRMKLEYDSTRPLGDQIIITPLGEWAYGGVRRAETIAPPEGSRQRYFPETNLIVYNGFLAFYEANQGERLLGPPVSAQLNEGGTRVQYFRNARLEWRPEAPLNYRVQLSMLGESHFYQTDEFIIYNNITRARAVDSASVRNVHISANVRAPILYTGDEQIIYLAVVSPELNPVSGVAINLLVTYNGKTEVIAMGKTDENGKIQGIIPLEDADPGQQVDVVISAYRDNGTHVGSATLSFKTWW